MKKTVDVVAAIIENENNEILCALRSPSMILPNMWEFPGGKIEIGENLKEAIEREIKEELDCIVKFIKEFNNTIYEYEKIIVNLTTVKCKISKNVPKASEHSKLLWLKRENLSSLMWAPADVPSMKKLMLEKV
ncbi:(deoxy)nucleoside triphosphate pyrophosphohydrolase [Clostridium tarantellae]|uniref:8-oxo-dGTP diphosphatase n=1 Tax=Clostridium tarantellae TaxID=39493 RepID=A0A6I1MIC2_9CLOT|nr:(deoxy)nucleoside triphosphate pyrophosphohydrolase [Clostridium tarantellae]MPQ42870.1 NUDIX domain-containing protein [Clostridium tarantellae]